MQHLVVNFVLTKMDESIDKITFEILLDYEGDISQVKVDFGAHSVWTIVAFSLVYAVLSLTAFLGNSLVIWVICKIHFYFWYCDCN